MTKTLEDMTPVEIIKAVREKDMRVVRALTFHLINEKKMTSKEICEVLSDRGINVNQSTVWRWACAQ